MIVNSEKPYQHKVKLKVIKEYEFIVEGFDITDAKEQAAYVITHEDIELEGIDPISEDVEIISVKEVA
jgi:hypothetical protein|tara:strand:+ start:426 stop:629 length:204 start_codon:yes stop_codon:yes gene_type:complete